MSTNEHKTMEYKLKVQDESMPLHIMHHDGVSNNISTIRYTTKKRRESFLTRKSEIPYNDKKCRAQVRKSMIH